MKLYKYCYNQQILSFCHWKRYLVFDTRTHFSLLCCRYLYNFNPLIPKFIIYMIIVFKITNVNNHSVISIQLFLLGLTSHHFMQVFEFLGLNRVKHKNVLRSTKALKLLSGLNIYNVIIIHIKTTSELIYYAQKPTLHITKTK